MKKREFLVKSTTAITGLMALNMAGAKPVSPSTKSAQVILTVTGAVKHNNRGKLDPMMDQMMHKQGVQFEHAYEFTLSDLLALPAVTINPTMEYDGKPHKLTGPLLSEVLKVVGYDSAHVSNLHFHGIDGYSPEVSLEQAQQYKFVLATHIDNKLLNIGGFGPLFALYDADQIPEFAQKPLEQRFAACPWGLYCIELS